MKHLKTFENYVFGREEFVEICNKETGDSRVVKAKIDTEAYHSNIDVRLATELNINTNIDTIRTYNILGDEDLPTAEVCLNFNTGEMEGRKLDSTVTIADRSELRNPVAIGRKDLEQLGILIDVKKSL
ncbi:MAG: putative acid protease [uncultured marine phage]|uniref:Putative acid protease n=1 Tax=uncultured marine phage TaxID=707152 RepID=A0A8D9CEF2_9VIRU|nr:MAG: putative acid protease [uncultured marine phage]